jgi:hypothetical protein
LVTFDERDLRQRFLREEKGIQQEHLRGCAKPLQSTRHCQTGGSKDAAFVNLLLAGKPDPPCGGSAANDLCQPRAFKRG